MSRSIFLLSLVFLICLFTEGQWMFISKQCLCSRTYDSLWPGNIKEWKVHKPSAFCDTTEIIVILKKPHIKVCLNPNSKLGRQLQANYMASTHQIIHQKTIK
ncbi:C-X-C motif chemokine 10-like [Sinocyclocheilus rhinocerous]|uniref:C-X-C motif chemokine 10-like n=1 Tax=Sinocyclocheilus rhinocerous TaxID=307959 RepID=UPI0007BA6237|nr:PREDICTED: C-X-C motif chemokine 10-like [Sinocyclocheilus rhinocerous]